MANPQLENGYIKIANELWGELRKIRIPGEAMQCLLFIIEKTYGWNKKEDQISLSQFQKNTGLKKTHICRSLNKLIEMNLIIRKGSALSHFTKKGNDFAVTYSFQKNYEKWNTLPKKVTLPKKITYVTQKGNNTLPKKGTTKDTTKDTITKDNIYIPIFEKFWRNYPSRNGKKIGKSKCFNMFKKIKQSEFDLLIQCTNNYSESRQVRDGYAKDPERFLRNDYWKEWREKELVQSKIIQVDESGLE